MDISLILLFFGLVFNLTKALQSDTCAYSSRINTEYSCENMPLALSCPKDTVIKISSAHYGRTTSSICPGFMLNKSCKASSSKAVVSEACSGKNECIIEASNKVFGDPCPFTKKYLVVNYCCESTTPYPVGCDTAPQGEYSCENMPLALSCPKDTVIKISSAHYGRTNSSICPGFMLNKSCKAPSSKAVVSEACSGKNECIIKASNKVFGDPCPFTNKYLVVDYCCESTSTSVSSIGVTRNFNMDAKNEVGILFKMVYKSSYKYCILNKDFSYEDVRQMAAKKFNIENAYDISFRDKVGTEVDKDVIKHFLFQKDALLFVTLKQDQAERIFPVPSV